MHPRLQSTEPPRWAVAGVLAASVALVWHSLGNHPLFPPDEGRYASVSGWMAEHGNWLAPQLRDKLHLTKPPLAYWAQAACVRLIGHTDLAVRVPSAIASTATILVLFAFARRTFGTMVAMLAVGTLASMPLVEVVGRLAITDPLLALWWFAALCAGWLAVSSGTRNWRWIGAFWASCALAGLTKGPLLLAPPAIVAAWLALAGRLRDIRLLAPAVGLPLAAAPLAVVAYGFWSTDPERAASVWRFEFVERFTGGRGHDDPWWSLLPGFFCGLFPASAMMTLPWFNMSPRRAWSCVRAGDLRALLVVAVVLPFVGFSALSGKEPTYLLPLAPPLALLAAITLARWVDGTAEDLPAGTSAPDVRITCAVAMTVVGLGLPAVAAWIVATGHAPGWAVGWTLLWLALPVVPAMVSSWIAIGWWARRGRRLPALGLTFVATAVVWTGFHHAEDVAMQAMGARPIAEAIRSDGRPACVFRLNNPTIDWYFGDWLDTAASCRQLRDWIGAHPSGTVVATDQEVDRLRTEDAELASWLRPLHWFDAWPMKRVAVLEVVRPPVPAP